jgi:hypothetical protein
MISIDIRADVTDAIKGLTRLEKEQVPFATAVALTRSAKNAETNLKAEIGRVFERPTPFTQNSIYTRVATKRDLTASVEVKNFAGKADAPIRWLAPQIYGGGRRRKRFEQLLATQGLLPVGLYAVPGLGARLDRYGNMSRGQIVQILSAVGASRDAGQNRRGKRKGRRRGGDYFVARAGGHLKPGVYERIGFAFGSAVRPVLLFVKAPFYRKRLRFFEITQDTVRVEFPRQFVIALNAALGDATLRVSAAA